jgi:hypothetical protein
MKPKMTEKPWPRQIWEAHRLLVTCAVISSVLLVLFSALQMRGSPILNLSVQWILVAGVPLLVALVADGYIRDIKIHRFEVGINQTRQNVESAVEKRELRSESGDEIPGKFENIKPYIDWQKFHEDVIAWARLNKAQNAWNLGPKNYLRCLYDLGIPGGKLFDLEYELDGSLKHQ